MTDILGDIINNSIKINHRDSVQNILTIQSTTTQIINEDEEFKLLYFKIQKLLNKKILISLKYEQLKTPEIHSTLIKPLTNQILSIAKNGAGVSANLVFILFLVRYEYQIQSGNNLVKFELLLTKSMICEMLAIRMLREYNLAQRIDLLFIEKLNLNTLELSILSESKFFLSHPAIIQILNKFYNGELILNNKRSFNENYYHNYNIHNNNINSAGLGESNIVNIYDFDKLSIDNISKRLEIVPKYKFMLNNFKVVILTIFYLIITIEQKTFNSIDNDNPHQNENFKFERFSILEFVFWIFILNYIYENVSKLCNVGWKFYSFIVWNMFDSVLNLLFATTLILRVVLFCLSSSIREHEKFLISLYINTFSLISIVIFPRILAIFNNYEFFNLVIISFKQMFSNLVALCCLFISLISGFYLSFISLSSDITKTDIAFDMLKIFFGFTPAAWNNWMNYNKLGKFILLIYLFSVQFLLVTLLIVVLSDSYINFSKSSKQEFYYLKTVNLIIHIKLIKTYWSVDYFAVDNRTHLVGFLFTCKDVIKRIISFPVILMIFIYELSIQNINKFNNQYLYQNNLDNSNLSNFTFFNPTIEFANLRNANTYYSNDHDINSLFQQSTQQDDTGLVPVYSNTLSNLKSASTDSLFIDELLNKKYGAGNNNDTIKSNSKFLNQRSRVRKNSMHTVDTENNFNYNNSQAGVPHSDNTVSNNELLTRINKLEKMISLLINDGKLNDDYEDDDGDEVIARGDTIEEESYLSDSE